VIRKYIIKGTKTKRRTKKDLARLKTRKTKMTA
jgi:hypothetical protein